MSEDATLSREPSSDSASRSIGGATKLKRIVEVMRKMTRLAVMVGSCWVIACVHPLRLNELDSVPNPEIEGSVSMGETMVAHGVCPCRQRFVADRTVEIDGRKPIPQNSEWLAKYRNAKTGGLYLVNRDYHVQLAAVLENGVMNPEAAIVQFAGGKRWRKWGLKNPADSGAFRPDGYQYRGISWRLQYLGPDGRNATVLRFSIEEYSGSLRDETIGQIEYVHDLSKGREFVIRGMRVRIDEVGIDGVVNYSATRDRP